MRCNVAIGQAKCGINDALTIRRPGAGKAVGISPGQPAHVVAIAIHDVQVAIVTAALQVKYKLAGTAPECRATSWLFYDLPCRGLHAAIEGHGVILMLGRHIAGRDGLIRRAAGGCVGLPAGASPADLVPVAIALGGARRAICHEHPDLPYSPDFRASPPTRSLPRMDSRTERRCR